MSRETINYSQCWEDPTILMEALAVCPDDSILSITSGGDNTLALLLSGPKSVVSIDSNKTQSYLVELKIAAAKALNYREYLEFLGVEPSESRLKYFEIVKEGLSQGAHGWWSDHVTFIERGAIHCGRFERYSAWFARYVLPFIHSKRIIQRLLSARDIEEQKSLYKNEWDSTRWRIAFAVASSRFTLRRYARQRGMFAQHTGETVADVYRHRLERHLTSVPIAGNFFLQYSLTGRYGDGVPPYLSTAGHAALRDMPLSALSIETNDLIHYLQSMPDNTFSKFNLSDVFEALSSVQNDLLWHQIVRTATPGAVVAYWNNVVKRTYPASLSQVIRADTELGSRLHAKDRVFFYGSFHVQTILK